MEKRVSRVKGMLEDQGYSPEKARNILELFDPPKKKRTKSSGLARQ